MLTYANVADFLMTGGAIAPAFAFFTDRPEFALLAHAVLLVAGLMFAAGDREAPFRKHKSDRPTD